MNKFIPKNQEFARKKIKLQTYNSLTTCNRGKLDNRGCLESEIVDNIAQLTLSLTNFLVIQR